MKTTSIKVLLACGATAVPVAIGSFAFAQAPASPPASASPSVPNVVQPPGGTSYPNQLSETRGVAQRFTLTPIGEIDGVILADGTEVHLPSCGAAASLTRIRESARTLPPLPGKGYGRTRPRLR